MRQADGLADQACVECIICLLGKFDPMLSLLHNKIKMFQISKQHYRQIFFKDLQTIPCHDNIKSVMLYRCPTQASGCQIPSSYGTKAGRETAVKGNIYSLLQAITICYRGSLIIFTLQNIDIHNENLKKINSIYYNFT